LFIPLVFPKLNYNYAWCKPI